MKYYSTRDAAEKLLGWKGKHRGKRLSRVIIKQEKKLGFQFAKRVPSRTGKPWLEIDEKSLRLYLPNLFEVSQIELATEMRSKLDAICESIPDQIASQIDERIHTGQRHATGILSEIRKIESGIMLEVDRLSRRIDAIERKI